MAERVVLKYDYRDLVLVSQSFSGLEIIDAGSGEIRLSNEVLFFSENFSLNTQADGLGINISGFDFVQKNSRMTTQWNKDVFEAIQVTDVTYQAGTIYAFGDIAGSVTASADPNRLQDQIDEILNGTVNLGIADAIARFGTADKGDGLLYADGRALSRAVYSALFAVIGTTFGVGDGSTTFNIPVQADYVALTDPTLTWHIKAESITPSGEQVSALRYDTGWVANSNWLNMSVSIVHNLVSPISGLDIKFLISTDGTDDNSFEFNDITYELASNPPSDTVRGSMIYQVDSNTIKLQTGAGGITFLSEGTGLRNTLDGEAWYYKFVITKPNLVATYHDTSNRRIYNIPDAVDVTVNLPDPVTFLDEFYIERDELSVGTGKVIPAGYNINGLAPAIWELAGAGRMTLIANGGAWRVKEYSDYMITSGNWSSILKGKDGTYKSGSFTAYSTNISEATMWNILSEYYKLSSSPGGGVSGSYESSTATFNASKAFLTAVDTITINTYNLTVSALTQITIKSDNTGNWDNVNEVALDFQLTGMRWRA